MYNGGKTHGKTRAGVQTRAEKQRTAGKECAAQSGAVLGERTGKTGAVARMYLALTFTAKMCFVVKICEG
eukprot:5448458-Pleurochrysis_carterae.AAC.2